MQTRELRGIVVSLAVLFLNACGNPGDDRATTTQSADPSLKPPVAIVGPEGNVFTCQAGPGAVCVQR